MGAGAETCVRPGPQILFPSARFQKAGRITNRKTDNHENLKPEQSLSGQDRNNVMRLNLHLVAIGDAMASSILRTVFTNPAASWRPELSAIRRRSNSTQL